MLLVEPDDRRLQGGQDRTGSTCLLVQKSVY
jgi:hypothetical protein